MGRARALLAEASIQSYQGSFEPPLRTEPERLTLADLGLDRLGLLEFCIGLEIDHRVVVSPERLVVCTLLISFCSLLLAAPRRVPPAPLRQPDGV